LKEKRVKKVIEEESRKKEIKFLFVHEKVKVQTFANQPK
jgi:hypothetical protein